MIKNLIPTLAERGKIKIGELGEERTGQGGRKWRLPKKLDYFVLTTLERDSAGQLTRDIPLMRRLLEIQNKDREESSGKLTEIPIRLLYDDLELNFQTRLACYKAIKLPGQKDSHLGCWCSGDRERAQRLNSEGKYVEGPCPCERWDPRYTGQEPCKTLGTLQALIDGTDRIGGVHKFRTTSWNSVNAIYSSLLLIQTITGGGRLNDQGLPVGPLAGIPLKLVISPKSTQIPTTGQTTKIWVVSLEYAGGEERLAQVGYEMRHKRVEHQIRMVNLERQALRALTAPHEEPPQEQEETAAEFFQEAEFIEGHTLEQDISDFNQQLRDHNCEPDDVLICKFIAEKATEHHTSSDEVRAAGAADFDAFWEEFETYKELQQKETTAGGTGAETSKETDKQEPPITPVTMEIIRASHKDLAGLLAQEGVRNLEQITERRGQEIVDMMNAG